MGVAELSVEALCQNRSGIQQATPSEEEGQAKGIFTALDKAEFDEFLCIVTGPIFKAHQEKPRT